MTAIDCPVCNAPFKEVVKDGILIDVCTRCQGVWLDRGELEKLLSAVRAAESHEASDDAVFGHERRKLHTSERIKHYECDDDDHDHRKGSSRKKSKLDSLFDVFD